VRPTEALAYRASIAAACVVAALRLLPFLGDRVMHRDEALAVMVARRPLGELLETVQLVRGGAPLHFLLAKLVAELGGGLVATRAVSALGLVLAIVGVGLLGRALAGPVVGVAAAWMLALSPVALYYGDFARMYSLFLAFSALALWCLVRALDSGETRYWAGTAALLVVDTYTHPYGVVVGLIAALAVLADLLQVRERAAWRKPLLAAAGVVVGTAPLAIGYLVLASRLDKVPQPPGAAIPKPSLSDVAAQAGAHFVGVPRAGGTIGLYLAACAALAIVGIVTIARSGAARGVLVAAWIVLPLGVLAVVRIPNSDNHVRYVIEALPLAGIAIAYGAWTLGRLAGWRGAVAATLAAAALVSVVEGTRGARLSDYRYRGGSWAAHKADLDVAAGYLRGNFTRNDLFLGYDEAFAAGVLAPGKNHALASARGTARSEPALIVRSLKRLHGPIAHGWYVALRGPSDARYARFRSQLAADYDVETFGTWFVLVRSHAALATPAAFARSGLRVFEAAQELSAPTRAPSEQAAVTTAALKRALPDLR
jgi:mannosyltransferase